jgi:tetratricopeptide (TPR) repeat protein
VSTVSRAGSTSLVTVVGLACLFFFASRSFGQDDPGKAAFEKGGCEMCHGAGASGGIGPALVPLVQDLEELTRIVRGGLGQMPSIPQSKASDADIEAIYGYLKRLSGTLAPRSPSPASAVGLEDVNARIDRARVDHDLAALAAAVESTTSALSQIAIAERTAHLAAAYAAWEWVVQHPQPPPESAKLVDRAIDHVERAVQLNDRVADSHGFMAALCALRLTLGSSPSPTLSARIASELGRAKALDAEGPRVLLLGGVAGVLAPAAAGGIEAAERLLRRAQELLPGAATGFAWPAWTSADAAVWLGRALQQRGDRAGARKAYEEALRLRPNDQWIARVLLPSVIR